MSVDLTHCRQIYEQDIAQHLAIPPRSHCDHCDAPVDHRGEYAPQGEVDQVEAVRKLMRFAWDHPQQMMVLCGQFLGHNGTVIAARMAKLTGRETSRQLIQSFRYDLAANFAGIDPFIFPRCRKSKVERAQPRQRRERPKPPPKVRVPPPKTEITLKVESILQTSPDLAHIEVAAQAGCSQQRVYQIAAKMGIRRRVRAVNYPTL